MAKLQSKRVIGATCASTSFDVMKNMQFKIVILDECSQMLEPQSLLPISKFNCRKLIAVGDPLQLPPIILLTLRKSVFSNNRFSRPVRTKESQNVCSLIFHFSSGCRQKVNRVLFFVHNIDAIPLSPMLPIISSTKVHFEMVWTKTLAKDC